MSTPMTTTFKWDSDELLHAATLLRDSVLERYGVDRSGRKVEDFIWYDLGPDDLVNKYHFREFIDSLDSRRQLVLRLRFSDQFHSFREVAKLLAVSTARASQLYVSVLEKATQWVRDIEAVEHWCQTLEDPSLDDRLEALNLTPRALYCLQRARIHTIRDVCSKTEADLLGVTNFGYQALAQLKQKLAERGLRLMPS